MLANEDASNADAELVPAVRAEALYASWSIDFHDNSAKLDECIDICLDILARDVLPPPLQAWRIHHLLGSALCSRSVIASSMGDLDEGLTHLHDALTHIRGRLATEKGMTNPSYRTSLQRFTLGGIYLDNLEDSIHLRRLILSNHGSISPEFEARLTSSLSMAVFSRFTRFPRIGDIEEVVRLDERSLNLCIQTNHSNPSDQIRYLCDLAQSRLLKWDYDGVMEGIELAIGHLRQTVSIGHCESFRSRSGHQ